MLRSYIKIALRNLARHKVHTVLNVAGLSIALVPAVLAILYIANEYSFDRFNKNYDRIYRLVWEYKTVDGTVRSPIVPNPLAATMKAELPEIQAISRMAIRPEFISYEGRKFYEKDVLYADPDFFRIFTLHLIAGNQDKLLSDKHSIVFSRSMAEKFFGSENPVGKVVEVGNSSFMTVTGVFKDMPENSHFHANFITSASLLDGASSAIGGSSDPNRWGLSMFYTYFLLRKNANPDELLRELPGFLDKYSRNEFFNDSKVYFQPLADIHLHSHLQTEFEQNGDIGIVYLYLSIAFILLMIACINYVNFATSRSTVRTKEIGVRKIVGAGRRQLAWQFLTETGLTVFCSFLIALMLVELILPYFNSFVGRDIRFGVVQNFGLFIGLLGFVVVISLLAGSYPAAVLSSVRPVSLVRASWMAPQGARSRNVLVGLQFVFSIVSVVCCIVVLRQLNYVAGRNLGYDRKDIVIVKLHGNQSPERIAALKTQLSEYPGVIAVSSSSGLPNAPCGSEPIDWPGKPNDVHFRISYTVVDNSFIDLYGLKMVDGREFSAEDPSDENNAVILNQTAVRELGWTQPVGKYIIYSSPRGRSRRKVIGVVRDFNDGSLYSRVSPLFLVMDPGQRDYELSVKISPVDTHQTLGYLAREMKSFEPQYTFDFHFFDELLRSSYGSAYKLRTLLTFLASMGIFLSCLGLFGLTLFACERRRKEIGIRRVMGGTVTQIVFMLIRESVLLVLIAGVIALPIAYYVMNIWLENFAYRANVGIWVFALSWWLVLSIAVLTVVYQAMTAATTNPVESLRYE